MCVCVCVCVCMCAHIDFLPVWTYFMSIMKHTQKHTHTPFFDFLNFFFFFSHASFQYKPTFAQFYMYYHFVTHLCNKHKIHTQSRIGKRLLESVLGFWFICFVIGSYTLVIQLYLISQLHSPPTHSPKNKQKNNNNKRRERGFRSKI